MTRSRESVAGAALGGLLVAFVTAIELARWIRVELLFDPEPSWAIPRLILGLVVVTGATIGGSLAMAALYRWSRTPGAEGPIPPLPLEPGTLLAIAAGAIAVGAVVRFLWLDALPPTLWVDEIVPIAPALGLNGTWSDFRDAIRVLETDQPIRAMTGVAYLELYRLVLKGFGVTFLGVRFWGCAAGVLSLATAALLGRALLPRGGGALTALVLAGLRWHLIFSRWGMEPLALVPVADLATLLLLRARRRRSLVLGAVAGAVAGIGAHIYLGAWIVMAALAAFAAWPNESRDSVRRRLALPLVFIAGFLTVCAPILLLREGRTGSYFSRAEDVNWLNTAGRSRSWMPPLAVVADSLSAPWFKSDPMPRHDIPGRPRLGWILGIPFAVILGRSLLRPRDELSALLFAHALAAIGASFVWGPRGHPNGFRFLHLTTLTAVAVAGGILLLVGLVRPIHRHAAALAAVGAVMVSGALGVRDTFRWAESRETFDGFLGPQNLIGRAAARWAIYGPVQMAPAPGPEFFTTRVVAKYGLAPGVRKAAGEHRSRRLDVAGRRFRLVPLAVPRDSGERVVERIADAWGREWGVVFGRRSTSPPRSPGGPGASPASPD